MNIVFEAEKLASKLRGEGRVEEGKLVEELLNQRSEDRGKLTQLNRAREENERLKKALDGIKSAIELDFKVGCEWVDNPSELVKMCHEQASKALSCPGDRTATISDPLPHEPRQSMARKSLGEEALSRWAELANRWEEIQEYYKDK